MKNHPYRTPPPREQVRRLSFWQRRKLRLWRRWVLFWGGRWRNRYGRCKDCGCKDCGGTFEIGYELELEELFHKVRCGRKRAEEVLK